MNNLVDHAQFGHDDVQMKTVEPLYRGFFKLDRYHLRHKLFGGGWSDWFSREVLDRGHAAAVLLYDPSHDQVVMVEQFRVGAYPTAASPWQLELVAGMLDKEGEDPHEVAKREAQEESGLTLGRIEKLYSYYPSAGGMTEQIHLYVAQVDAREAGGIHGLANENEDILVHVLDRTHAVELTQTGRIDNAAALIALQWLTINVNALRVRWGFAKIAQ
ncbi:ADP-ribose diphosphatase [Celerinatantimonas yamalensis]|uniref:ADP-ribose pyrophosphatase n=1 Tax=Celerinatantimonas yamalensis TaxID=559956 RepID=A0ABW9G4Y5_9GAMM